MTQQCGLESIPPSPLRRRAPAPGFLLAGVSFGGLADGLLGAPDEGGPIAGGPVHAALAQGVEVLEAGHHVAGDQLVGALGLRPVRPVVGDLEEGAEAARLLPEALDLGDGIVGIADYGKIQTEFLGVSLCRKPQKSMLSAILGAQQ